MKGTIKEKLTLVVILIVVAAMVISSAVIVGTSGSKLTGQLTSQLQINADKYANSINSWIEMEKGLNSAGAAALAALPDKSYNVEHAQQMVTTQAAGHPELLNLYYGMADKTHLQMDPNAKPPEEVLAALRSNEKTEKGEYCVVLDLHGVLKPEAEKQAPALSAEAKLIEAMKQGMTLREAQVTLIATGEKKNTVKQAAITLKRILDRAE